MPSTSSSVRKSGSITPRVDETRRRRARGFGHEIRDSTPSLRIAQRSDDEDVAVSGELELRLSIDLQRLEEGPVNHQGETVPDRVSLLVMYVRYEGFVSTSIQPAPRLPRV